MRRLPHLAALLTLGLLALSPAQTAPPTNPAPAGPSAPSGVTVTMTREPGPQGQAARVLREVPAGVRTGLLVTDVKTGEVLSAQNADHPLIPASTVKIVTATAVLLDRGGPQGWWSTELTVPAAEVGRAEVSRLTLRGTADPTLSAYDGPNSLRALVEQAQRHGLRKVGRVRLALAPLDAGSFEATELGLSMPALHLSEWENRPPTSATEARRRLGNTLIAELQRAGIKVGTIDIAEAPLEKPYVAPPQQDEKGRPLPPNYAIQSPQQPDVGIASVRSGSPWPFLAATLRPSDNYRAEVLLASLGMQPGQRGSLSSALKHELELLRRMGLDLTGVVLKDGSGLGRGNRLPPRFLTSLLKVSYDLPYALPAAGRATAKVPASASPAALPAQLYAGRRNAFVELLPQAGTGETDADHAGRGGTLARRMLGSGLDTRAKTGTLPGVSGLSGYVTAKSGRVLAFTILMNGPETSPILTLRDIQDRWVEAIAAAY